MCLIAATAVVYCTLACPETGSRPPGFQARAPGVGCDSLGGKRGGFSNTNKGPMGGAHAHTSPGILGGPGCVLRVNRGSSARMSAATARTLAGRDAGSAPDHLDEDQRRRGT